MRLEEKLEKKGVKNTANRILVLKALSEANRPVSLSDLEAILSTLDKSSIFRVLTLFLEHRIVHAIEDGSGSLKYEICSGDEECSLADMHIHFYCELCRQTYCFESMHIPTIELPVDYVAHSINYMIKGECPKCRKRHERTL